MVDVLRRGRDGARAGRRLAGALAAAVALSTLPVAPARASHYAGTEELSGSDPVGVSVAFSQRAFPDGAAEAVLGRSDVYADSLASGALQAGRPLILTDRAALSAAAKAELERLKVKLVHILGGTGAIGAAVEQQLTQAGYTVRRHSGPTRIETAVAIGRYVASRAPTVIVARAFPGGADQTQGFADALAAGGWAAASGSPIVLTESERLSAAAASYLQGAEVEQAFVVGGTGAVSQSVEAQLAALGAQVTRVAGPTRFDTAVEIAKQRGTASAADAARVILLDGQRPDAWVSGFASAALAADGDGGAIVLSNGEELPAPTLAWLEGTSGAALVCAPSAAEAACDAAAEALGKLPSPKVTLGATTVGEYESIAGKVEPADRVASLKAGGCGVAEDEVLRNQDGSFTLRIPGPTGTCTLVFTVRDTEGASSTSEFSLTVTKGAPATSVPYLEQAEVTELQASYVIVRFTFSEPIRATTYAAAADNAAAQALANQFLLYGPGNNSGAQRFAGVGLAGVSPRRDPADSRSALVRFDRTDFDAATIAAVLEGAAKDTAAQEYDSLPGSAPLRELTYPGGTVTGGLNLTGVGSATVQNAPPGRFRVTFTYDATPEVPGPSHVVVLSDGSSIAGKANPAVVGSTTIVDFDPADTRLPSGTACSGSTCPSLQTAVSGVRRGYVVFDTARTQSAAVLQEGATATPDLTGVTLDQAAGTATFTFDQAIANTALVASRFRLYDRHGGGLVPTGVTRAGDMTVRATYAANTLHEGIVGAFVERNAVSSSAGQAEPASVALTQTLPTGFLFGPRLVSGRVTLLTSTAGGDKTYEVRWVFDRDLVAGVAADKLDVVTDLGNPVALTGSCTRPDARTVVCTTGIVPSGQGVPALALVEQDAVTAARQVFGAAHGNVEQAARL